MDAEYGEWLKKLYQAGEELLLANKENITKLKPMVSEMGNSVDDKTQDWVKLR